MKYARRLAITIGAVVLAATSALAQGPPAPQTTITDTSLTISAGGKLGVGTTNPEATIHAVFDGNTAEGIKPRGIVSQAHDNTAHSAHITARKARGTAAAPATLQVGDYIAGFTSEARDPGGWVRSGYLAWVVDAVPGAGQMKTYAEISVLDGGASEARRLTVDVNGVGIGAAQKPLVHAGGAGRLALTVSGTTERGIFEMVSGASDADGAGVGNVQWTDKNSVNADKRVAGIAGYLSGDTPNNRGGRLEFLTRADSGNSFFTKMLITPAGDVGIGTQAETEVAIEPGGPGRTGLTIMGATERGYLELATRAADGDGAGVGNVQWTDKNSVNAEQRVAAIAGILAGGTANNRGGDLQMLTRADSGGSLFVKAWLLSTGQLGLSMVTRADITHPLNLGTIDGDASFKVAKSTAGVVAPGAGFGLLRWEAGTNAGTLKLVVYSGTSTTPVVLADNVGGGN